MTRYLWVLALAAAIAWGADVTGKWSGSFQMTRDGEVRDETAWLVLKQDGARITGTAGPDQEKQFPIKAGSIEGDVIKLEVAAEHGTIFLDLKVDGDRITGDARGENSEGDKLTAKLDLKRQK
jgi:hypothetical protein